MVNLTTASGTYLYLLCRASLTIFVFCLGIASGAIARDQPGYGLNSFGQSQQELGDTWRHANATTDPPFIAVTRTGRDTLVIEPSTLFFSRSDTAENEIYLINAGKILCP